MGSRRRVFALEARNPKSGHWNATTAGGASVTHCENWRNLATNEARKVLAKGVGVELGGT